MAARWEVYLLRCQDGSLYCGITTDLEKRVEAHNAGRGARYTRGRGPVAVVASRGALSHTEAARLERLVKRSRRHRKVATLREAQP